jgi:tetratricopeptide (TPR) repeat protein
MDQINRALEMDRLSLPINRDVGLHHYYAARYDQAIEQYLHVLEMDPNYSSARRLLARAYLQIGRFDEAISQLQNVQTVEALSKTPSSTIKVLIGYAYAISGRKNDARQILNELNKSSGEQQTSPIMIAAIYGALDDKDQAFACLDRAYQERAGLLVYLKVLPELNSLRTDSRFHALEQRLRLAD